MIVCRVSCSQRLICAGISDTTGPSLILLFFFLASYPEDAEKIHDELTSIDPQDLSTLSNLPHLNGVINESMRLLPAALSMGTRVTPPEGLHIEGTLFLETQRSQHLDTQYLDVSLRSFSFTSPTGSFVSFTTVLATP